MAFERWPDKDPQDVADYAVDWSETIGTDTIFSSTWQATPSGLTVSTSSIVNKQARVRISGGTDGVEYTVLNHIITSSGQEFDQQLALLVVEVPTDDLLVEDGTGILNADSYVSEVEIRDWLQDHPSATWKSSSLEALARERGAVNVDSMLRGAARVSCKMLNMTWGPYFRGTQAHSGNYLPWPRLNAYDVAGEALTGVPKLVKEGQMILLASHLTDDYFEGMGRPMRREFAGPAVYEYNTWERPGAEAIRWAGSLMAPLLRPMRLRRVS